MTQTAARPVSRPSAFHTDKRVVTYLPIFGAFLAGVGGLGWFAVLTFAAIAALRLVLRFPDVRSHGLAALRKSEALGHVLPRLGAEAILVFFAIAVGRGIATVAGVISIAPLVVGAVCLIPILLTGREVYDATAENDCKATQPA